MSLLAALTRSSHQAGISRHCFSIPQVAAENRLYEHIGRLEADPDHPVEQVGHRIAHACGCPLQPLEAGSLNLLDLLFDKAEASHVAPQLGQRVGRRSGALRGEQSFTKSDHGRETDGISMRWLVWIVGRRMYLWCAVNHE